MGDGEHFEYYQPQIVLERTSRSTVGVGPNLAAMIDEYNLINPVRQQIAHLISTLEVRPTNRNLKAILAGLIFIGHADVKEIIAVHELASMLGVTLHTVCKGIHLVAGNRNQVIVMDPLSFVDYYGYALQLSDDHVNEAIELGERLRDTLFYEGQPTLLAAALLVAAYKGDKKALLRDLHEQVKRPINIIRALAAQIDKYTNEQLPTTESLSAFLPDSPDNSDLEQE